MTAHLTYEGLYVQSGGNLHDHTTAVFDRDPNSPGGATYPFPVGPRNDEILAAFAGRPAPIVAAWGDLPCDPVRARQVHDLLAAAGATVLCLGTTGKGHPRHPSREAYATEFVPYTVPKAAST